MLVKVLGKCWRLRFVPNLKNRGDIDPPEKARKEIRIGSELRGELRLDTILHELTHAAGWLAREECVGQFATDAARVLWRLGYRDTNESDSDE